jgi:chromosome segregation protein
VFVKSLRLAGFKSFADLTVLEFERGVNVIVGPNGSGKSNIADALSWVLGSQAPSTVRGDSMEDVIFAGSAARPGLDEAEVELTLDNSSKLLGIDVTDVAISRCTDRTGASEYRINGVACRLLDIAELLSDTGIGRTLHTVVGQGQLDQALQARPEDRRLFVEEAAQIGKFRRRKDRSLKKIERVDDNLMRLNDVLTELRRGLRPLKRQVAAATAYSELVQEQLHLRQRLTATEMQRLTTEEQRLDLERETRRAALLSEELSSIRARLVTAARDRDALATMVDEARLIAQRTARNVERFDALGRLGRERAARLRARLEAETEESYRERIRLLGNEQTRWRAELDHLTSASASAARVAEQARRLAETAAAARDRAEGEVAGALAEETEAAQALVRAEGSEAAGRTAIGSLEARIEAVVEQRRVSERELSAAEDAIAAAETDVRALEAELSGATEAAAQAEVSLEDARTRSDALHGELSAVMSRHAAARARLEAFREVEGLFADHPAILRLRVLIADARKDLDEASTHESRATETLDDAGHAIEVAWQLVARRDEELQRLDALMSGASERLTSARRRYEAKQVENVARDAELARAREALADAQRAAVEERAALPARRAALEQACATRRQAEAALATARAEAERTARALNEADIEARAASERSLAAEHRLEEAQAGIADARGALASLEHRRSSLETARELADSVSRAAELVRGRARSWAETAEAEAAEVRRRAKSADGLLASLRARERELEEALADLNRLTHELEVRRAEMRTRSAAVAERAMDDWGLGPDDLLRLTPLDPAEEQEAHRRIDALEREIQRLGPVNPSAADEYAEVAERERFLVGQMDDLRASKRDLMKIIHEVDDTIVDLFAKSFHDVAAEFERVFQRLFPGGTGRLRLTDPDDLLGSGIEIEARPPGKNVKKMSLLSGGERSLVALAFLFSIFRARPSPFYLLDEVEAALDDVNLSRFLLLLQELEERAQVLVVTHQKRTMEAADVLYGVSMGKTGVSQVVARRMAAV